MNTRELIEQLSAVGVRCLDLESVTSVKTAADTLRQAVAVLDATAGVMECAGRLSDLHQIVARSEALKLAVDDAETALDTTRHFIEELQGEA